jgi:hypothetical protein
VRLNHEPALTIRMLIGDERADQLGKVALDLVKREAFSVEELKYLAECVDELAWFKSEYDALQLEEKEGKSA